MLSRLAERVYWIGRLVERADDLARLVATYDRSAVQLGAADPGALRAITHALGSGIDDPRDPAELIGSWVVDPANRSSVVACVSRARQNALGAREVLSLELWENLHAADAWLAARTASGVPPAEIARTIPVHTHTFFGLLDSVTVRDETWCVVRAGALIERASMTARTLLLGALLAGRLDPDDPLRAHGWSATLRACAALDAFRRGQVATPDHEPVEQLLLRDPACPRSVAACCDEAARLLSEHGDAPDRLRALAEDVAAARLPARGIQSRLDEIHHALIAAWRGS